MCSIWNVPNEVEDTLAAVRRPGAPAARAEARAAFLAADVAIAMMRFWTLWGWGGGKGRAGGEHRVYGVGVRQQLT